MCGVGRFVVALESLDPHLLRESEPAVAQPLNDLKLARSSAVALWLPAEHGGPLLICFRLQGVPACL